MKKEKVLELKKKFVSFRQRIKELDDYSSIEDFFASHEDELLPIDMLLLKARAIQLTDSCNYCLEDVERVLMEVLNLYPDEIQAKIELAYFYYAVMDRSADAIPFFSSAIELCESSLDEAICGKARVIEEIEGIDKAVAYLQSKPFQFEEMKSLLDELLDELPTEESLIKSPPSS